MTLIRVLHVHSGNLYGGVETLLLSLLRGSAAEGMATEFALSFEGRFAEEMRANGGRVDHLGVARFSRPWTVWRARRALRRLLEARPRVAVVHSGWSHALFGSVIRRAGIPLVRWLHGVPNQRLWLDRRARAIGQDFVICNSEYTAREWLASAPGSPHALVRPGVPAPSRAAAEARERTRTAMNVPPGTTVVVQVGRMERGKGHHTMLGALAGLRDRTDWVAWQVGGAQRAEEQRYVAEVQARTSSLGLGDRLRFLGERRDVADLLAAADVYCQPNETPESFGITFVEALYAGLPVVTSAIGGAVEIVDESCGILIPPADAERLQAALRGLLADPVRRRSLGAAGPARADSLCNPGRRIAEAGTIMRRLAGQEK